jgi:hypothetical protein
MGDDVGLNAIEIALFAFRQKPSIGEAMRQAEGGLQSSFSENNLVAADDSRDFAY